MRRFLVRLSILVLAVVGVAVPAAPATAETAPQVYGAWHCSDAACIWGTVRSVTEFDSKNLGSSTVATVVPASIS